MKRADAIKPVNRRGYLSLRFAAAVSLSLAGGSRGAQAGPGQTGASLKLWPSAVVSEEQILLRDLVELHGFDPVTESVLAEVNLGEAPPAGGSRIVSLVEVQAVLAASAVNLASVVIKGAAECVVRRPAELREEPALTDATPTADALKTTVQRATLRDAIVAFFNRELAAYDAKADLQFGRGSLQSLDVVGPEYEFEINRQPGAPLGLANLDISILREGRGPQRVAMVVNVAMMREVAVAKTPINKGAPVRPSDVILVARRFTRLDELGLTSPGEVIGQRAKRFIPGGEMIQARDLERLPLVKRGQMVEVVSRIGGITIRTSAKAADDAGFGEAVTLHLPGRKREKLVGRVAGPRQVELSDSPPVASDETALAKGEAP